MRTGAVHMRFADYGDRAVLIDTDQPLQLRDALMAHRRSGDRAWSCRPLGRCWWNSPDPARTWPNCWTRSSCRRAASRTMRTRAAAGALRRPGSGRSGRAGRDVERGAMAELTPRPNTPCSSADSPPASATSPAWTSGFGCPGWALLGPSVPAGSVAIADEFTGVYPQASPGWLAAARPDRGRRCSTSTRPTGAVDAGPAGAVRPVMIEVIATGPFACLQDLGRFGYEDLGVSRSGAADQAAHRLANRLVGNADTAATIEFVLGGLDDPGDQPRRHWPSPAPAARPSPGRSPRS